MTRINLIPVKELHNKHLIAEYRELPRIFNLAVKARRREYSLRLPEQYVLGTGHVRFFYNKLKFLHVRFAHLAKEMESRGYNPSNSFIRKVCRDVDYVIKYFPELYNFWEPSQEDIQLNQSRIDQRLKEIGS